MVLGEIHFIRNNHVSTSCVRTTWLNSANGEILLVDSDGHWGQ